MIIILNVPCFLFFFFFFFFFNLNVDLIKKKMEELFTLYIYFCLI